MNRIALSDRLEGMSKIFTDGNPMSEDLKAMAHALRNTTDERFASVLNTEFEADKQSGEEVDAGLMSQMVPTPAAKGPSGIGGRKLNPAESEKILADWAKDNRILPKAIESLKQMLGFGAAAPAPAGVQASEEVEASEDTGLFWTKEATDYITANLLKNVLGMEKSICCDTKRQLTPDQIPDGGHAGEKAKTLKPDQVPDQEYLDSKMVEKSHGAAKKEANEQEEEKAMTPEQLKKHEDKETPAEEAKEEAKNPKAEEAEEKKLEKKAVDQDDTFTIDANTFTVEGIELSGSMDEVDPSSEEIQKLAALFN